MYQRMVYGFFGLLITLAIMWLGSIIGLFGSLMSIVPFVVIPVVLLSLYFLASATEQGEWRAALDKYWWLWVIPLLLALVSTTCIAIVSYTGGSVPILGWGLRGTPWGYVYACNAIAWFITTFVVALLDRTFFGTCMMKFVEWVRRGGCWKIGSTHNLPANSLFVIYGFVVTMTILHGLPSPDIDPEMHLYEAERVAVQAMHSDVVQTAEQRINNLVGREIFSFGAPEPLIRPEPRYIRGWGWIKATFLMTPLVLIGWALSRRDGAAAVIASIGRLFGRRKEKLSGVGTSDTKEDGSEVKGGDKTSSEGGGGGGRISHLELLGTELEGKTLFEFLQWMAVNGAEKLSKMLHRA